LAIEFVALAIEFVALAIEFIALSITLHGENDSPSEKEAGYPVNSFMINFLAKATNSVAKATNLIAND